MSNSVTRRIWMPGTRYAFLVAGALRHCREPLIKLGGHRYEGPWPYGSLSTIVVMNQMCWADREAISPDLAAVSFIVVFVDFALLFVSGFLVRTVAERLVLRQPAHTDPDRFFLWFDFERPLG
jgi:hypothetical protein